MLFPYHGPKPEKLTADLIIKWAHEEMEHFQSLLAQDQQLRSEGKDSYIRPDECVQYIIAWNKALLAGGEWEFIPATSRNEILSRYYEEFGDE